MANPNNKKLLELIYKTYYNDLKRKMVLAPMWSDKMGYANLGSSERYTAILPFLTDCNMNELLKLMTKAGDACGIPLELEDDSGKRFSDSFDESDFKVLSFSMIGRYEREGEQYVLRVMVKNFVRTSTGFNYGHILLHNYSR